MANWFDKDYYLTLKLLQLDAAGQRQGIQDIAGLDQFLQNAGMSAESHYLAYGHSEGLNPSAYFNETEYLNAKLAQLHEDPASGWAGKNINELRDFMASAGLTVLQHYEAYGAFETRADGTLLNPSNGFDANAYMQAKLVQLQQADPSTQLSVQDVVNIFRESGLSPVSHALAYGQAEADQSGVDMIQTVPDAQRVGADPARAAINSTVPGNSAEPTLAPSAVTTPHEAQSPFDMDDVALPTPQPVAPAPAPDPTPDPNPGPAPEPGPGYKYNDLILARHEGNTLYFDVNEDSQAYGLLFSAGFLGGSPVHDGVQVIIEVHPNIASLVMDGSNFGGKFTQMDVKYWLMNLSDSKLMVDQLVTVPVGTVIDLNNLPGDGWNWLGYAVNIWPGGGITNFGETIVSGPGVTIKVPDRSDGGGIIFDSDNNWTTLGVVEILSNTGKSTLSAQAFDDVYAVDGTDDDDMVVDVVGVDTAAGDMVLA